MRLPFLSFLAIAPASLAKSPCPCAAEATLRWQDQGGIEGMSLEWMLDRARPAEEATR